MNSNGKVIHDRITHSQVWRIAGPIILSNMTVPLMGAVDTAVVGHLPDSWHLGAVAIGAMIFNCLYWGFGFLRMGTTGLTAQAVGKQDDHEIVAHLVRALLIALSIGIIVISLQLPIVVGSLYFFDASPAVEAASKTYSMIRIWGAPAALANFVLLGWFIGIQRTGLALGVQLVGNFINIFLDLLFVVGFEWGVSGVAIATVFAEYSSIILGGWLVIRNTDSLRIRFSWSQILRKDRLSRLFAVNFNIFLRSFFLLMAAAYFTIVGARQGDLVLAANAVLLNFVHFMAYGLDGFAFAAEALVGESVGKKNLLMLRRAFRITTFWAIICGLGYFCVFSVGGEFLIGLLTSIPEVRATAKTYLPWVLLSPILAVWSYQLDGIFIGATRTADMRNGMALSLGAFIVAAAGLVPLWENHGLWAAMSVMWVARALTLAVRYPALEKVFRD